MQEDKSLTVFITNKLTNLFIYAFKDILTLDIAKRYGFKCHEANNSYLPKYSLFYTVKEDHKKYKVGKYRKKTRVTLVESAGVNAVHVYLLLAC